MNTRDIFDPTGQRLLVADKGTDHVHVYRFDPQTGHSTPLSQVYLGAGFGPRYMAVHPSWRYLYVIGEIESPIRCLAGSGTRQALRIPIRSRRPLGCGEPESKWDPGP